MTPNFTLRKNLTVRARPSGAWTLADEFVEPGVVLQISASDQQHWSYADSAAARCGPDGDPQALLSRDKCIMPAAPVGSLIAKIGGSTADAGGKTFLVGSFCVFQVPDEGGPLYLTINDESGGLENNSGTLEVVIWKSDAAAPPAPASASRCIPVSLCIPAGSFDDKPGNDKSDNTTSDGDKSNAGQSGDGDKSGGDKSGGDKSGDDKSGDDTSGDDTSGDDTSGDDTSGDDTSGDEDSSSA